MLNSYEDQHKLLVFNSCDFPELQKFPGVDPDRKLIYLFSLVAIPRLSRFQEQEFGML